MSGLEGRIAMVTGGGSGLGAAIAARLAADGAVVVVNDITGEAAERTAHDIRAKGGQAGAAAFDVAGSAAVDQAVDAVVHEHGRLDILVNNAGIAPRRPEVRARGLANMAARMSGGEPVPVQATSTLSDEEWDRMLRIHLYGTFHCTRAALRHMEPARSGAIVNMASIAGLHGIPGGPEYSAAKGGVIAFTKSVAGEVAPLGIRVNAVAPAYIDTPLIDDFDDTVRGFLTLRTPLGRLGRPEEVAAAVRFLVGDEAGYCVGEVHTVTGGFA
ncbi:MAG TPA: SDR family NAD(P)-dependent oxidoreductase [Acidimicrobiales bacterium]|jgi:3-oxoacyl-[acyl-carrier protein] reductase|nr:SDR family NAD(P)-dependent oxidoreductase [Acidimicrobiales bacterium]